jgi:signal transduction histidine kinase
VQDKRTTWRPAVRLLFSLLLCSLAPSSVRCQVKPVRRILILHEVGPSYPISGLIDQGIRTVLDNSPYKPEFYYESLEVLLFPDPADQKRFRDFFVQKYTNRVPDVIITVGPHPLELIVDIHDRVFPGVPVIFCLPNGLVPSSPTLGSDFTGVETDFAAGETLRAALRLQPGTQHVVIVAGVAEYDRQRLAIVKRQLKTYEDQFDISYFTDLAMPTLLERLGQLPSHTVVLMTAIGQDATGTRFTSSETGPMVSAASNAPVFSLADVYLGHGEVGGDLTDISQQGKAVAGQVLRVLQGEKPREIPRIKGATAYMFDWRALRRWGFKERDLPPGSIVVFRELSPFERNKHIWITALLIIVGLCALAIYLQFSRRQLKQARDAQMHLSAQLINAQERERRRLASELHDDFSQRMALLAFGLESASEGLPESSQTAKQQLHELWTSASEIGVDLHTISHQLYSSTLESLGLVSGIAALCKEFTARQGIQVGFSSGNVPRAIPPDVALCMFRIVQEALQNLRKHSGAIRGEVTLRALGDRLLLSVQDEGCGFDAKGEIKEGGMGIRSMGERARMLGGHFEIYSEPGKGTRLEASVPLGQTDVH